MPTIHNLGNQQPYLTNQTNFSTVLKDSHHGKHKNPNYHREYYLKNREKLLAYGHIYYGVKRLLKPRAKKEKKENPKNGVKKFSHTHEQASSIFNSLTDRKDYVGAWKRARDRQDIRLATKEKRPQYPIGSNWPTIKEMRKVQELITKYGEWGHRTGKRLGNYWDIRIDLDFYHEGTSLKMGQHWEGSFKKLMSWLGIKYDKTQKGVHVNLLLKELPSNCSLYHTDKYGKKRIVGSILSVGRQAQGLGSPHKEPAGEGKWALKAENIAEVAQLFNKFFFVIDYEAKTKQIQAEVRKNQVSNGKLDEINPQSPKVKKNHKQPNHFFIKLAQILKWEVFKKQIQRTKPIYKLWYKQTGKSPRYFLLDTYQKHREMVLDKLPVGSINNFVLNQGQVYQFFYGFS